MILRTSFCCPGCNSRIVLRIQLGVFPEQPFFVICNKCELPTKGKIILSESEKKFKVDLFEVEDDQVFDNPIAQITTVSPDLPCIIDIGSDMSESPFFLQLSLMKGKYIEYDLLIKSFKHLYDDNWKYIKKLIFYFEKNREIEFNKTWLQMFDPQAWPPPNDEFQRSIEFYRLLTLFFEPFENIWNYGDITSEFSNVVKKTIMLRPQELFKFINCSLSFDSILSIQHHILERLSFFTEQFSALSPGLALHFYEPEVTKEINKLRITRDDLEQLKYHYINSFEVCHKLLFAITGLGNLLQNGDSELYHDRCRHSAEDFERMSNRKKAELINYELFPLLRSAWLNTFNPNIRNGIGHNNVIHDLTNGYILINNKKYISYTEFVYLSANLTPLLIVCYCITMTLKEMLIIQNRN